MSKYYRVKKDTFICLKDAILSNSVDAKVYKPVEDVWDKTPVNAAPGGVGTAGFIARLVEHESNADIFERVYKDSISGKLFQTKDQIVESYNNAFKK